LEVFSEKLFQKRSGMLISCVPSSRLAVKRAARSLQRASRPEGPCVCSLKVYGAHKTAIDRIDGAKTQAKSQGLLSEGFG